jgi:hypothetical protein
LIVSNKNTGKIDEACFSGLSAEFKSDYVRHYAALDPYSPLLDGSWIKLSECLSDSMLRKNKWYKAGPRDMDVALAEQDVVGAGQDLVAHNPDIGAIVLECTNMPPYAAALQAAVGIPVYDIYSMITWFHAGLRPPRVFLTSSPSMTGIAG